MDCDYHVSRHGASFWSLFWAFVGIVILFIVVWAWNEVFLKVVYNAMGREPTVGEQAVIALILTVIFLLLAGSVFRFSRLL